MIKSQHTIVLILWKTPSYGLVSAIFEEKQFIPEEKLYFLEKVMLEKGMTN